MRIHRAVVLTAVALAALTPIANGWFKIGDHNFDGVVDVFDIDGFVDCLISGGCGHAEPIDYWSLDGLARDYGVLGNHGQLAGDTTWSTDVPPMVGIGQSASFDGAGDYIYLGPGLLGGDRFGDFTFQAWFKAGPQTDPHACIFSTETTDGEFNVFIFEEDLPEPVLYCAVYLDGYPETIQLYGPDVTDNIWHQVALRNGPDGVSLFLDGTLVDYSPATGSLRENGLWHATIGCKYTDDPAGDFFEGLIDEVKIYDRALSDSEIGVRLPPTGEVDPNRPVASLCVRPGTSELYAGYYPANYLTVIDMDTLAWYDACTVGNGPSRFVFNAAGDRMYVSLNPADKMASFSMPGCGSLCETSVGSAAAGIALSKDERRVFVANHVSHTLSIINVEGDQCIELQQLAVGNGANGVAVNADGTRVYVANGNARTVSVVEADTVNDVYTVICETPSGLGSNLAYSQSYSRLYVTNGDNDRIVAVDTSDPCNDTLWIPVSVSDGPKHIAMSPNERYVFVSCEYAGTIDVIDADTLNVIRNIPVGSNPQMVVVHPLYPNGDRIYVADPIDWTVTALDPFANP